MAAITRWDANSWILQTLAYKRTLENFQPNLRFYDMGAKAMFEDGYNTVSWLRFDELNVTVNNATLTDWVTPNDTAFNAIAITASPAQYGIVVNLSDMLISTAPVNFVNGASEEVGNNMAKIIDKVIQTEVMAGTNVQYANGAANRAALTTSDNMTGAELLTAFTTLDSNDSPKMDGYYVAIVHPQVVQQLREDNTATGFLEASKYTSPEKMMKWEIGSLNWVRVVSSSHVQTFASTATVYPTLVLWQGAYGVSTLQNLRTYVTGWIATDSDPLAQRIKVWSKVAFVPKRLQEDSMVRIESA